LEPISDIKTTFNLGKWFLKIWKQLGALRDTPQQVAALEKRVAELESRLQRAPGSACQHCGALAVRVESVRADPNFSSFRVYRLKCKECGFEDEKTAA
jgi:hypothetical protein